MSQETENPKAGARIVAGRRYRGVALVPPATSGDPLRGRGRAGGSPSQPGERARGGGAHGGRGVPHRREAHRRARCALPRVRPGALGAALEAARRRARRRRTGRGQRQGSPGGGRPGGRRRGGHQGPGAVRREDARGPGAAGVLRPQPQPLRAPAPGGLLRLEAVARAGGPAVAGGAVRGGGRGDQPHAVRSSAGTPRSWRRCTCRSRCGSPWATRMPPAAGAITISA